jgi:hypothetical protein
MGNVAYYRLRSIDVDGSYRLSAVAPVYDNAAAANAFVVANPVHDAISISAGSLHSGDYDYHIMTVAGQIVQQGRLTMTNGGNYRVALSPAIVHGIYIVAFHKDAFSYRQQVLVQ